jgi:hypothetical protein
VLDGESPDARTLALISLVQACNLLDEVFAPAERPAARRRIVELIKGRPDEGSSLSTLLGVGALFGLVGATMVYGYQRMRDSFGGRFGGWSAEWDPEILDPWVSTFVDSDGSTSSGWSLSGWIDPPASPGASGSDATPATAEASGDAAVSPSVGTSGDDTSPTNAEAPASDAGSGGWLWWWGGGSDSASTSNANDSGSSWWGGSSDSGGWSADSSSSDSGSGWDSGSSSDSGGSDSGGSSC